MLALCGKPLTDGNYYYFSLKEGNDAMAGFVTQEGANFICGKKYLINSAQVQPVEQTEDQPEDQIETEGSDATEQEEQQTEESEDQEETPSTVCGNGRLESDESCDDGDLNDGDGCNSNCRLESGYQCSSTEPSVCNTSCGDMIQAGDEECDNYGSEGCDDTCHVVKGWHCGGGVPTPCYRVEQSVCGDGLTAIDEECDKQDNGIGCDTNCHVQSGWTCNNNPPPSRCTQIEE